MAKTASEIEELRREIETLKKEVARLKRQSSKNERRRSTRRVTSRSKRVVKLGGLWVGTPEITEQDIAEVRREVWGQFGNLNI